LPCKTPLKSVPIPKNGFGFYKTAFISYSRR
jgi:hypothetical protein